ncbi:hypothetical protein C8J57DRAFT_1518644 [Mycena rebaudengoi]|nr:hypothetical protein C8J57DRAFT_1518644 [Mycena rebaudengoi]
MRNGTLLVPHVVLNFAGGRCGEAQFVLVVAVDARTGADELNGVSGELIKLPALYRLHVEDSIFLDLILISAAGVVVLLINGDVDSVLTFLHCSGAQLTSLSIIAWEPSPDLIPILGSCPILTHLCLDVAQDLQNADTVIPVLHALGNTNLCPELTLVFWRDKTEPNRTPDAFKEEITLAE